MRYPVGFWNYPSVKTMEVEEVKVWADAGITLNMSPGYSADPEDHEKILAMLDLCEKYGMKLIMRDYRTGWNGAAADPEGYRARFLEAYNEFGKHPACYGFFIGDEPSNEQFEDCKTALAIQREEAPELTGLLNLLPYWPGMEETHLGGKAFDVWAKDLIQESGCRLVCYDHYAQLNPEEDGTDRYFLNLNKYSSVAIENNIPVWTTLLSVGHFRYRVPSEDDLRWQVNTAAASGCRGLLWFTFYGDGYRNYRGAPINEYREKTPTYTALSYTMRRFHDEFGEILMDMNYRKAYHFHKAYGGYAMYEEEACPGLRKVYSDHCTPGIVSFYDEKDGGTVFCLVNNSPFVSDLFKMDLAPGTHVINLRKNGAQARDMKDWHHDAFYRDSEFGDTAGVYLAPGQMEMFRIVKD